MPHKNREFCDAGNFFRQARLSKGLTQDKLSELAQVSPRHVTNLENGKINPSYETMRRLLNVLQVDPRPLFCPDVVAETDLEKELIRSFRRCEAADQMTLLKISSCLESNCQSG